MKKITITLAALILLASGCQDTLEKEPLPSITPENFFKNVDDAEAALTSVYDALQNGDGGFGNDIIVVGEMPSDNCTSVNGDVTDLDRITWNPRTTQVRRIFAVSYQGINRTNAVLKYVPGINIPAERKNQILGQAYFLRALNYFTLVQLYGGVPLRLEPVESADPNVTNLARSTEEQVYTQILADLTQAETLTPATYGSDSGDRIRATKTTVNALQTRVLLTQRQWSAAQTAADKVIASNKYTLAASFDALFPAENHPESIFEIQYTGTRNNGGNTLPDLILPVPLAYYDFDKYNRPTTELIQYADTVNDLRWAYRSTLSVAPLRSHVSYVDSKVTSGTNRGPFAYKWRTRPTLDFNNPDNTYVLRYADVLLMRAEAANEQGGPGGALATLNQVRRRAGLPALTAASPQAANQQAMRDEIDRQRRLEFAFEGLRWFDLLRYARHSQATPTARHAVTALDIIADRRSGDRNVNYLLFPIPQNELDVNNLAQQNPGF